MRDFAPYLFKSVLVDVITLAILVQVFFGWPDVINWLGSF